MAAIVLASVEDLAKIIDHSGDTGVDIIVFFAMLILALASIHRLHTVIFLV